MKVTTENIIYGIGLIIIGALVYRAFNNSVLPKATQQADKNTDKQQQPVNEKIVVNKYDPNKNKALDINKDIFFNEKKELSGSISPERRKQIEDSLLKQGYKVSYLQAHCIKAPCGRTVLINKI